MFLKKYFQAAKKVLPIEKTTQTVTEHKKIDENIENNLHQLVQSIGNPSDLVTHRISSKDKIMVGIAYLESLSDGVLLGSHVIEPINNFVRGDYRFININTAKLVLSAAKIIEFNDLHDAIDSLLAGQTVLFLAGADKALAVSFPGFPRRQIEEPLTEKVLRGSREGFTEVLKDNLAMVRRWIKDPNLRVQSRKIGERTKTEIAIIYLNDVANPDIVAEVGQRLEKIDIDGITDSGYISELISDRKLTLFPLTQETERPDKVVAALLEGRVIILVDKSPFAVMVPVTAAEFYQNADDFYFNFWIGTFLRFLRAVGTLTATTLPGLYLATMSVNPELLPPVLVQLIASERIQIPFPAVIEIFITMLFFDIVREASFRVPGNFSLILGIGGGIVVANAAMTSGFVSGVTLMIVVVTSIASFSTSSSTKEQAWRIVRYFLLLGAGSFGIVGLTLAGLIVLTHMASLNSFGVSYLAPWSPPLFIDMFDAYVRIPWWASFRRPQTYRPQQEDRLSSDEKEEEP